MRHFILYILFFTFIYNVNAQFVGEFQMLYPTTASNSDYGIVGYFTDVDENGYSLDSLLVDGSHFYLDKSGNQYKVVGRSGVSPATLYLDLFQPITTSPTTGIGQLTSRSANNQYYTSSGIRDQLSATIQRINADSILVSASIIVDQTTGLLGGNSNIPLSLDTNTIATQNYVLLQNVIYGEFDNDVKAGQAGVPLDKRYRASQSNTMGLSPGTIRYRKY